MRNSSICVSGLVSLPLLFFIAHFSVVLGRDIDDRTLGSRSREADGAIVFREKSARYIPARWNLISPKLSPPETKIEVFKGHVPKGHEGWAISTEYKLSSKDYKPSKMESADGRRTGNELDNSEDKVKKVDQTGSNVTNQTQIESRNIIDTDSSCISSHRKDQNGKCREVIHMDP